MGKEIITPEMPDSDDFKYIPKRLRKVLYPLLSIPILLGVVVSFLPNFGKVKEFLLPSITQPVVAPTAPPQPQPSVNNNKNNNITINNIPQHSTPPFPHTAPNGMEVLNQITPKNDDINKPKTQQPKRVDQIACEELKKVEHEHAKFFMETLEKEQSPSVDKIDAFDRLNCSSDPVLRLYAQKISLTSKNEMLKSKAFAAAVYDRKSISIFLINNETLGEYEKKWIKDKGGMINLDFYKRDYKKGCIDLKWSSSPAFCEPHMSIQIQGLKIIFGYDNMRGELSLVKDNTLGGFLKPRGALKSIPIKAELF